MIREEKFLISRRPYAAALGGMRIKVDEPTRPGGTRLYHVTVPAVWFRRRRGVLVAVKGTLWDLQREEPKTIHEALERHDDGRYGGAWIARWDGERYVSEHPQPPEVMEDHLDVLRPMLEDYPAVPPGYDGWWRF